MKPYQTHREWKHKDAHGSWWLITVDAIERSDESVGVDAGDYHWKWHYEIRREDVLIDSGEIQGQHAIVPDLNDVLREFGGYVMGVILDMAACDKPPI